MRRIETAAATLVRKIGAIGGQAMSARADAADPVAGARLSRTPNLSGPQCRSAHPARTAVGRQNG